MDWEHPNDPEYWKEWSQLPHVPPPSVSFEELGRIWGAELNKLWEGLPGTPRKCATEVREGTAYFNLNIKPPSWPPYDPNQFFGIPQFQSHAEGLEQNCGEE